MEAGEAHIIVGLGELLWDCFGEERKPGGAPANVAFHANQLGAQGVVCSRVGEDPLGDKLLSFLQAQGLRTDFIQRDDAFPTGTVTVHLEKRDGPAYTIHERVAWDRLVWTESMSTLIRSASALCYGTLAQRTASNRAFLQRCLQAAKGVLKVYDINLRPPFVDPEWIIPSLEAADVVKLNIDECGALYAQLDMTPLPPATLGKYLNHHFKLRMTCITRGDGGCLLVAPEGVVDLPGIPVEVVDTVGAGDAFTACLIVGILRGWPLREIGERANCLGALVASTMGGMPLIDNVLQKIEKCG
ncbi:MAG: carbohydrate kinase [Candidatus Hydrogenedentes bacterium]|nr:carbohydrate kinase [Candidatus Hydrogenedentota bacterium]